MAPLSGHRIRRVLFIVFVFAMAYQVALSLGIVEWLARGGDRASGPIAIVTGTRSIYSVSSEAASAGVHVGDEIVMVEGRPYTGRAVWAAELRRKHAGDVMTLSVKTPGHLAPRAVSVPLESAGTLGPWGWPVIVVIYVLTQFCALLLGFAVALIRPRDPMAWLLLVMMVSFASFAASGDVLRDTIRTWPDGLRQGALMYHVTVGDLWSMCVLLFGIYFAGRAAVDRRAPWLKWLFIAPVVLGAVMDGIFHVMDSENVAAAARLRPFVAVTDPLSLYTGNGRHLAFLFCALDEGVPTGHHA